MDGTTVLAMLTIFAIGAFILQGLRRIPAQPPHVAVVTIFGKRTAQIKSEGWRFFPLHPFWYGAVLVDITQKNLDLPPQLVRTPELGEIEVRASLTWTPDSDYGNRLINYLNAGGQKGVENILTDIVKEKTREFAINNVASWEDVLKMREDLVAMIAAHVLGGQWAELDKTARFAIANGLRQGNGLLKIPNLGIVLNRLNVTAIAPKGRLAEAAEQEAKEKQERRGEVLEMEHVSSLLKGLTGLGFSNEQALEIVQTERGKIKKDMREVKLNVSQETRTMIEKIGESIVEKILKGGK